MGQFSGSITFSACKIGWGTWTLRLGILKTAIALKDMKMLALFGVPVWCTGGVPNGWEVTDGTPA